MDMIIWIIIGLVVGAGNGAVDISALQKSKDAQREREAASILDDARKQAETLRKEAQVEAKDEAFRMRQEFESEKK